MTVSHGLKSTTLYGPVPTGLRLFGDCLAAAPLSCAKTCFGMMQPLVPTKGMNQPGVTSLKAILTVRLSSFSTLSIEVKLVMVLAAVCLSVAYSQVKTTSSAEKGWPSLQVMPSFSFQVTLLPSAASRPFSLVGISAASSGTN